MLQSGGINRKLDDFRIIDFKDILFENEVYIMDRDVENISPLRNQTKLNKLLLSPKSINESKIYPNKRLGLNQNNFSSMNNQAYIDRADRIE